MSIVQRKALTPNDFDSLEALAERLLCFVYDYRQIAQPFTAVGSASSARPSARSGNFRHHTPLRARAMLLNEDERLRSDAEVERFLRSVAPGS